MDNQKTTTTKRASFSFQSEVLLSALRIVATASILIFALFVLLIAILWATNRAFEWSAVFVSVAILIAFGILVWRIVNRLFKIPLGPALESFEETVETQDKEQTEGASK